MGDAPTDLEVEGIEPFVRIPRYPAVLIVIARSCHLGSLLSRYSWTQFSHDRHPVTVHAPTCEPVAECRSRPGTRGRALPARSSLQQGIYDAERGPNHLGSRLSGRENLLGRGVDRA